MLSQSEYVNGKGQHVTEEIDNSWLSQWHAPCGSLSEAILSVFSTSQLVSYFLPKEGRHIKGDTRLVQQITLIESSVCHYIVTRLKQI